MSGEGELASARRWRMGNRAARLVVNVGDVHDEVDLVAEVVAQDAAHDVLREVVPAGTRVRVSACEVDAAPGVRRLAWRDPCARRRRRWGRSCTKSQLQASWSQSQPAQPQESNVNFGAFARSPEMHRPTLVRVNELYTLIDGSSTPAARVGSCHESCVALGLSTVDAMARWLQMAEWCRVELDGKAGRARRASEGLSSRLQAVSIHQRSLAGLSCCVCAEEPLARFWPPSPPCRPAAARGSKNRPDQEHTRKA